MKKIRLCAAVIFSTLFLAGCDFFEIKTCEHEYGEPSIIQPTCEEEGLKTEGCTLCSHEKKTPIPALGHSCPAYTLVEPTCLAEGGKLGVCERCGNEALADVLPPLGHSYGEWKVVSPASDVRDGVKERTCSRCGGVEKGYITSTSYVDLSVLLEPFDENTRYEVTSYERLLKKFRAAILHQAEKLECTLGYDYGGDLNGLLDNLVADYGLDFGYGISARALGNSLTLTFTHREEPSKKSSQVRYEQYESANYAPTVSTRAADFDDFKIDDSRYAFTVRTTEQLHYVLERGVKPVCEAGSTAARALAELKRILITAVNDDMRDEEKVRAIYDYLVMNVTYDGELYDKIGVAQGLSDYNAFYLEGVLFDKVAVCEGISKAFTALCNLEGIPCVSVTGAQTKNPSGVGHAWNKVYLEGKWYIVDATSGGTIINESFEALSYQWYLLSEQTYSTEYTGENYTQLICAENYDPYANSGFTYGGVEHDFVVSSQAELNALIAYFESFEKGDFTVEFKVNFDVGNGVADELRTAYRENGLTGSYNYVEKEGVCLLVK